MELSSVSMEPDFVPDQPAFYHARVREIPTPRSIVLDRFLFGVGISDRAPGADPYDADRLREGRANLRGPIWLMIPIVNDRDG